MGQLYYTPKSFSTETNFVSSSHGVMSSMSISNQHLSPDIMDFPLATAPRVDLSGHNQNAVLSECQYYKAKFEENVLPSPKEESRNNDATPLFKGKYALQQSCDKSTTTGNIPHGTAESSTTIPSLPRRACLVHHSKQYPLDHNLLSQPRVTKYFVKERTEICPGHYMAKLKLR